jgi:hypothetical protein
MYYKAQAIYYTLAMFLAGTALFVMQPTHISEVTALQDNIKQQFSIAWQQTVGDGPWFDDVALVYDSIDNFYNQTSTTMIGMLQDRGTDADIVHIYAQVYRDFAAMFGQHSSPAVAGAAVDAYISKPLPPMPADFMSEEPLYNLIPEKVNSKQETVSSGTVSGTSVSISQPVNSMDQPWVTLQDAATGQEYCVAVYNSAVNKYLGACKNDYH